MTQLGDYLRKLRGELSLRQVGKSLGLDSSNISRYERGKDIPSPEKMQKFAEYFKIPLEELTRLYYEDQFNKFLADPEARFYFMECAKRHLYQ